MKKIEIENKLNRFFERLDTNHILDARKVYKQLEITGDRDEQTAYRILYNWAKKKVKGITVYTPPPCYRPQHDDLIIYTHTKFKVPSVRMEKVREWLSFQIEPVAFTAKQARSELGMSEITFNRALRDIRKFYPCQLTYHRKSSLWIYRNKKDYNIDWNGWTYENK